MQNNNVPPSMDEMFRQPQATSPQLEVLQLQRGGIPNPEQAIIIPQTAVIEHLHTENARQGLWSRLHGNFGEWFTERKEIYHQNLAVIKEENPNLNHFFDEIKHTEHARLTLYEKLKYTGINVHTHVRAASHALRGNRVEYAPRVTESRRAKEVVGRSVKVALGAGLIACRGAELVGKAKVYGMSQAASDLMDTLGKAANRRVNGLNWDESFQFGTEYFEAFIGTQLSKFGVKSSHKLSIGLQELINIAKVAAEDPEDTIITHKNLRKAVHHL